MPDIVPGITYRRTGRYEPVPKLDNASQYRYCTECMVTGTDIDRRKLRESLAELGDSLVLAGTKRKAKVHVHVDDPELVFDDGATSLANVSARKKPMTCIAGSRAVTTHEGRRRFAVITDSGGRHSPTQTSSASTSTWCRAASSSAITGLPGQSQHLNRTSSYEELRTRTHDHPTTSQPAPGDFRRQYQFLASHFADVVISINLTGMVSGTLEAARSAAAERVNAR